MSLLQLIGTEFVQKTDLSRKLTLGGVTKAYPVYRVRLDQVFYNDQNDRIATWITQYKNDQGSDAFIKLEKEALNDVIESFIIQSNPGAIEKTKNNINLVGQREPGVVLSDGRIIDGNRRFTCLRLLNKNDGSIQYFDTVILDASIENSKKQIKMLELAIQHGEEQRVDYNQIDLAIGAYRDIVETQLLTVKEYSESTNETLSEVNKRLEIAKLIVEMLEHMNVAEQYHIAREMQVYSVFVELVPILRKLNSEEEKRNLRISVFNNVMMGSFADNRRYLRNLKAMVDSGFFHSYMKEQNKISEQIAEKKAELNITNKNDLNEFVRNNEEIIEDLQFSMDKSLLDSKKEKTRERPTQIVEKSISLLSDIDTRILGNLADGDKGRFKSQLESLSNSIKVIQEEIENDSIMHETTPKVEENVSRPFAAYKHQHEPIVYVANSEYVIRNLVFTLNFSAIKTNESQRSKVTYYAYFVDGQNEQLTDQQEVDIEVSELSKVSFSLNAKVSSLNECILVLKSEKDSFNEAQQAMLFKVEMLFNSDFDF